LPGVLKNVDYTDPLVLYRGMKILDTVKRFAVRSRDMPVELAIDVFYSLYLPFPVLSREKPQTSGRIHYKIIDSLLRSPEIHQVRYYTIAESFTAAAIATVILHYILQESLLDENDEGSQGEGAASKREPQSKDASNVEEGEKGSQLEEKIQRILKKALDDAKLVKDIERLAYGLSAGVGHRLDFEEDVYRVLRLAQNSDVRKILEFVLKVHSMFSAYKRRKQRFSRGEFEGYTRGHDVERIVPSELAYPDVFFYAKFADSQLILYDKVIYMSMGPLYVLIDKSGSMEGSKMLWAKATAIALLLRSRKERRPFYVRFFDSEPFELFKVESHRNPSSVTKLMEYIAKVKNGGGTDITKAVVVACNDILRSHGLKDVSDIVLITDGEDRVAKNLIRKYLAKSRARLITVMIQGDNEDLRELSDKYLKAVSLSAEEMLKVVEA